MGLFTCSTKSKTFFISSYKVIKTLQLGVCNSTVRSI